jgi:DNA-directed RNA polymerase alpha subunit
MNSKTNRFCKNGHQYKKSSECPICPLCEKKSNLNSFFEVLNAPARRALQNANIDTLAKLASYSEKELLLLHGFGKASLPALKIELEKAGLSLKNTKLR